MNYKRRIFIYAYNECNFGDDLFVHAILRRYPYVKFYMHGNQELAQRFQTEKNATVVLDDSWLIRQASKIRPSFAARIKLHKEKRCDAVVYIGGSIFIEYKNWQTILTWWQYQANHYKFYALGANFGPWHTEEYRRQLGEIFSKMQDVCFRDKYSLALFSKIQTVRYAPDILFGYPMPKMEIDAKQAFISVINCESKDEGENQLKLFDQSYTEGVVNLTKRLIDQGWKVVLSSFCKAEGDEEGVKKIIAKLGDSSSIIEKNYDGFNADEILNTIAASAVVYGTRFHAVILGFAARRPVIPLIYSDKTKNILEDMQFSGEWFDIRKPCDNFGERAAAIAEFPERQRLYNFEHYAKQSEEHFLKLNELIQ